MSVYEVTIVYSLTLNGTTFTNETIKFLRKAKDSATAIAMTTSLFASASNYVFETANGEVPSIAIQIASAAERNFNTEVNS